MHYTTIGEIELSASNEINDIIGTLDKAMDGGDSKARATTCLWKIYCLPPE